MRVVHVSAHDTGGGAAGSAYALHAAMRNRNIDSWMAVADKTVSDPFVIAHNRHLIARIRSYINAKLLLRMYPKRRSYIFSPAWLPSTLHRTINRLKPDIINLHWVCHGFLTPATLTRFNAPIIWTVRDMWPFTGGCHHAMECTNYRKRCGKCPTLGSSGENDASRRLFKSKVNSWKNLTMHIVGISTWIAGCAKESALFGNLPVSVIHNAVDMVRFRLFPREFARDVLNLPRDAVILAFGAATGIHDDYKGFPYLRDAIMLRKKNGDTRPYHVVVFGLDSKKPPADLPFPVSHLGYLHDTYSLALLYSAADVTVVSSMYESFGKIAMESLACSTPVLCFDTTGLKDIVDHKVNGFRARCFEPQDLAEGLEWILYDDIRFNELKGNARKKAIDSFGIDDQIRRYEELYRAVCNTMKGD